MLEHVKVMTHSSIAIKSEQKIYIDPFQISDDVHDADIILITHEHYDHFSLEDIAKVKNEETLMVVPESMFDFAWKTGISPDKLIKIHPCEKIRLTGTEIEAVPAYNNVKAFHIKENGWVGYLIKTGGVSYFIAGDTDMNEYNKKVHCDVALVPIGGTYTMDAKEAAEFVNFIQPKIAIPTHYGNIVGSRKDAKRFMENVEEGIKVIQKIKF